MDEWKLQGGDDEMTDGGGDDDVVVPAVRKIDGIDGG